MFYSSTSYLLLIFKIWLFLEYEALPLCPSFKTFSTSIPLETFMEESKPPHYCEVLRVACYKERRIPLNEKGET